MYLGECLLGISTGSTKLDGILSSFSKGEYYLQRETKNYTTKHQVVCNTERCEAVLLPMELKSSEQKLKFKNTLCSIITNAKFAASLKSLMDKLNFSKIKAIESQGDSNFSMLINIFYLTDSADLLGSFVTEESIVFM